MAKRGGISATAVAELEEDGLAHVATWHRRSEGGDANALAGVDLAEVLGCFFFGGGAVEVPAGGAEEAMAGLEDVLLDIEGDGSGPTGTADGVGAGRAMYGVSTGAVMGF